MPADWSPSRATKFAVEVGGVRWSGVSRAVQSFREHPQFRDAVSTDWNREWLRWLDDLRTEANGGAADDAIDER